MSKASMSRAIAAALIASTLLAGHSVAFAQPSAEAESARIMEAAHIAVPVVRNGRLVNYLFITVRVDVAPGVDLWRTRERAHFLRDALVRAAHRVDLADPAHDDQLNRAAAIAAFQTAAQEALGPRAVRAVRVIDIRSARPVRTASR